MFLLTCIFIVHVSAVSSVFTWITQTFVGVFYFFLINKIVNNFFSRKNFFRLISLLTVNVQISGKITVTQIGITTAI